MHFPLDNFFVDLKIIVSTRTTRKQIAGAFLPYKEKQDILKVSPMKHIFDPRILFVNSTMLVYSILKGYPV